METGHCQICDRDSKIVLGYKKFTPETETRKKIELIAHHGYQRPGDGRQTASCYGARRLAYEVSNDAMAPYIHTVQTYLNGRRSYLFSFTHEPPETLTRQPMSFRSEPKTYTRPEGFSPEENEKQGSFGHGQGYEYEFHVTVSTIKGQIVNAEREIKRMSKRLAEWKPTK